MTELQRGAVQIGNIDAFLSADDYEYPTRVWVHSTKTGIILMQWLRESQYLGGLTLSEFLHDIKLKEKENAVQIV